MSTLTSKGQITVPAEVRRKLALSVGDKLRWSVRADGVIEITREPTRSLAETAGMLGGDRTPRARAVGEMDEAIAKAVVARDRASRARRR